jgi:hypothetical protein
MTARARLRRGTDRQMRRPRHFDWARSFGVVWACLPARTRPHSRSAQDHCRRASHRPGVPRSSRRGPATTNELHSVLGHCCSFFVEIWSSLENHAVVLPAQGPAAQPVGSWNARPLPHLPQPITGSTTTNISSRCYTTSVDSTPNPQLARRGFQHRWRVPSPLTNYGT